MATQAGRGLAIAGFNCAAARSKTGRNRLPPASIEYRMAACKLAGRVAAGGRNVSIAASTSF